MYFIHQNTLAGQKTVKDKSDSVGINNNNPS